jgi:hypothetical protein
MAHGYEDNAQSIGRTPLVRLNHLPERARARILAKIEGRNPAYPVKCRIGAPWYGMPKDAARWVPARSSSSPRAAIPASRSRSSPRRADIR